MKALIESILDMRIVSGPGIMDPIVSGMCALIESGDIGYSGDLWAHGDVSRAMAYDYMHRHPECPTVSDAVERIREARRKFSSTIIDHRNDTPNLLDRMDSMANDASLLGKFIIVPGGYGAIGKVTDERTVNGDTVVNVDVATKGGRAYTREDIPVYGLKECTDPALISLWHKVYKIPEPAKPSNAVSASGIEFRPGDSVRVTDGQFKDFDGIFTGEGAVPNTGDVKINLFGRDRIVPIDLTWLINTTPGRGPKPAPAAKPADGRTVRKAVWPGFRR